VRAVMRPGPLQARSQQHAGHGAAADLPDRPATRPQNVVNDGAVKHGRTIISTPSSDTGRFSGGSTGGFPRAEADDITRILRVEGIVVADRALSRRTMQGRDVRLISKTLE
jgi:hypothetical protein